MSWVNPDITSPSYWLYTAAVMAGEFERFVREGCMGTKDVPLGVLNEAKRFFLIIFDGKGGNGKRAENPEESANIELIATRVTPQIPKTLRELDLKFRKYASFIDKIGERHKLEGEELETAKELLLFFTNLRKYGEQVRSSERIHGSDYWQRHGHTHLKFDRNWP
jgi:hypothetical protein